MSYDIYLNDPVTGDVIEVDHVHHIRGGTYALGGSQELHLSVTYNYCDSFMKVLGARGIRELYGKTGADSILVLQKAIASLKDDVDSDYWANTEGNAKQALCGLLAFAQMRPDGVWSGD